MLTCLITGDVHFDYMVNVISVRFLHCTDIIFFFAINKYLMKLCKNLFSHYTVSYLI